MDTAEFRAMEERKQTMKVSVIIPVYKAENYIEKAVKSALEQDETGEVILIPDKSPDNSLAKCLELEKKFDKVIVVDQIGEINHGGGRGRNLGILNAKFELLSFLDADDFYLPFRFKNSIKLLTENPDADGVYEAIGTFAYDDEGLKLHLQRMKEAYNNEEYEPLLTTMLADIKPENLFWALLEGKKGWFHFNGLTLRKTFIEKTPLMNETMPIGHDTDFFFKLSYSCRLIPGELLKPVAMRCVYSDNETLSIYKSEERGRKLRLSNRIMYKDLFQKMLIKKFSKKENKQIFQLYILNCNEFFQKLPVSFFRKIVKLLLIIRIFLLTPKLFKKIYN